MNCGNKGCPKGGIKIHNSNNDYRNVSFNSRTNTNTSLETLDLNIDNYSVDDLYRLFSINSLDENAMRESKKIVLKTHPDKSNLDQKYFLFFSSAYKRLHGI